jgi:DNA polymerase-3 subunit alpha/error-prone DNA polymerase
VSFQAAYLKTHFPAEFMAAVISNQGGFYSTAAYVSETRRLGVRVLPPDVNRSEILWKGGDGSVRVGWLTLHHLSEETRGCIVAQRPYRDLVDLLERARPDEQEARVLVHARAFDGFHPAESHAAQLWQIAAWRKSRAGRKSHDLFTRETAVPRPLLAPDDPQERLREEMRALGFLCDVHPMVLCAAQANGKHVVKAKDLPGHAGRRVRCAGFLVTGKVVSTLKGEPMEFITFEDDTGLLECTFFPEIYRRFCHMLDHQRPYFIEGKVEADYGAFTITVDGVSRIELDQEHASGHADDRDMRENGRSASAG